MFFRVHVLYIDEGPSVYGWTEEQHRDNLQVILGACEKYEFTWTILPLESIYDTTLDLKQPDKDELLKFQEEKKLDFDTHTVLDESVFGKVKN